MAEPIKLFTQTEYFKTIWPSSGYVAGSVPINTRENPHGHYVLGDDGGHYFIGFASNALYLGKYPIATPVVGAGGRSSLWNVSFGDTPFCCGVKQIGNFMNTADVPENVGNLFVKIMLSIALHTYNKGSVQGYFYRYDNSSSPFQHEYILNALVRNGFRCNTDETKNPNSGNVIIGYEFNTNSKKVTPTKAIAKAVLEAKKDAIRREVLAKAAKTAKLAKPTLAGN